MKEFPMCRDCVRAANQIPSARLAEDPSVSWLCVVCGKLGEVLGDLEAVQGAFRTYVGRLREALQKAQQP